MTDKKSDGCTYVRDFNLYQCCEAHDELYNHKQISRREADRLFRECIKNRGRPALSWIYWAGVRLLGWYYWRK